MLWMFLRALSAVFFKKSVSALFFYIAAVIWLLLGVPVCFCGNLQTIVLSVHVWHIPSGSAVGMVTRH